MCLFLLVLDQSGSHSNGGKAGNGYKVGEKEQWCLSTLGYVRAYSRQYASEVRVVYRHSATFHFVLLHSCCSRHLIFIESSAFLSFCSSVSSKLQYSWVHIS